jgi:uncharacterized alpha-E superfamily protein
MWEQINKLYLLTKGYDEERIRIMDDTSPFTSEIIHGLQLIQGITASTLSHGEAYHFCRLGRMLERADKTSRILDVKYHILLPDEGKPGDPLDLLQWAALLRSLSGYSICRKQYGSITPVNVISLLILDPKFPRSIFFCISEAQKSLMELAGHTAGKTHSKPEKLLGTLQAELEYTDEQEIIRHGVHEYLDKIQIDINRISDALRETFFALKYYA